MDLINDKIESKKAWNCDRCEIKNFSLSLVMMDRYIGCIYVCDFFFMRIFVCVNVYSYPCCCDAGPFGAADDAVAVGDVVYSERLVVLLVRLTKFVPAQVSVGQPNDSMITQWRLCLCSGNDPAMQQSMHINRSLSSCHRCVIEDEVPRLRDY